MSRSQGGQKRDENNFHLAVLLVLLRVFLLEQQTTLARVHGRSSAQAVCWSCAGPEIGDRSCEVELREAAEPGSKRFGFSSPSSGLVGVIPAAFRIHGDMARPRDAVRQASCGKDNASEKGLCQKMRCSMLAYVMFGTAVTAFHNHETPCFGVCMMGKGFGKSNNKPSTTAVVVSNKVAVPSSTPKKSPAVGELPEDSFSQFPPLTLEQQSTLVGAKGGGRGLPTEVSPTTLMLQCVGGSTASTSARVLLIDVVLHQMCHSFGL